jgi:membrane protein
VLAQLKRLLERPVIAHARRAGQRFGERSGGSFAAGIAYFSVISLVPLLMVVFSAVGLVLTVINRSALATLEQTIRQTLSTSHSLGGDQVVGLVTDALDNWAAIGLIGLVSALWTGAGWMGHLKQAIQIQLRDDLSRPAPKRFFLVEIGLNLVLFVIVVAAIGLTFAAAPSASLLGTTILDWLGLTGWLWRLLLQLVSWLVSLAAGLALFALLLRASASPPPPRRRLLQGALIGAVGLAALQLAATWLIAAFSGNLTAALFGPVLVLMLFFNLLASLILMVAAWIGSADDPGKTTTPTTGPAAAAGGSDDHPQVTNDQPQVADETRMTPAGRRPPGGSGGDHKPAAD